VHVNHNIVRIRPYVEYIIIKILYSVTHDDAVVDLRSIHTTGSYNEILMTTIGGAKPPNTFTYAIFIIIAMPIEQ